jgi:hypothetical protein
MPFARQKTAQPQIRHRPSVEREPTANLASREDVASNRAFILRTLVYGEKLFRPPAKRPPA